MASMCYSSVITHLSFMSTLLTHAFLQLVTKVFQEMDLDGSGEVSFSELLKLMYPYATVTELEIMESWVSHSFRIESQLACFSLL